MNFFYKKYKFVKNLVFEIKKYYVKRQLLKAKWNFEFSQNRVKLFIVVWTVFV